MSKHPRNDFTIEELYKMPLEKLDRLLTHKEWAFVQACLRGYTRRRAYKIAYPDCKASDRVVDTKAYELGQRGVVRVSFDRHLNAMKENKFNVAFLRGQRATKELEDIAYGEKEYPAYTINGEKYMKLPSLTQRMDALKELRKDDGEMLKNESAAETKSRVLDSILSQLGDDDSE